MQGANAHAILSRLFFGVCVMNQPSRPGLLLIGAGTMLTSMVVSGFVLGYLTDRWLDSLPLFMLLFGGLGFVGGILKVYKLLAGGMQQ